MERLIASGVACVSCRSSSSCWTRKSSVTVWPSGVDSVRTCQVPLRPGTDRPGR
jgi:hypothetical protein